jgi:hypothetical protein
LFFDIGSFMYYVQLRIVCPTVGFGEGLS